MSLEGYFEKVGQTMVKLKTPHLTVPWLNSTMEISEQCMKLVQS